MPSDKIALARGSILIIPLFSFMIGFFAMFLVGSESVLWTVVMLGIVSTIIFLLYVAITLLDEIADAI